MTAMPSDELCRKSRNDFYRSAEQGIEREADAYIRQRDLIDKKLLALWPKEASNYSIPGTEQIIFRIQSALRATYRLAINGDASGNERPHWSYDVNRHMALLTALRGEQARLKHLLAERRAMCEAAE